MRFSRTRSVRIRMLASFDGVSSAQTNQYAIECAAAMLRAARRVLVITGAGISADSGLPTYRGIGGLYDSDETEDGIAIEDALSIATFERDPALSWKKGDATIEINPEPTEVSDFCRVAIRQNAAPALTAIGARLDESVNNQRVQPSHPPS